MENLNIKELYARKEEILEMFEQVGRVKVKTTKDGNEYVTIIPVWYPKNGWAFDLEKESRKNIVNKVVNAVKAKIGMSPSQYIGYTQSAIEKYKKQGQTRNLKIAKIINENISKYVDAFMTPLYGELKDAQNEYFELSKELKSRFAQRDELNAKIDDLDMDSIDIDINIDNLANIDAIIDNGDLNIEL